MSRRDRFDQRPEDRFVSGAYSFIDTLMLHKTVVTILLVVIVGGVLGWLAYRNHVNVYNENAQAAFEAAKTVEEYKNIVGSYPGSRVEPVALFYEGRKLVDAKKYDEAGAVFSSLVEAYPRHALAANALAFSGMISEHQKKYEEAVRQYQALLDRYQDSFMIPLVLINMGTCYEKQGEKAGAKAAYERVVKSYAKSAWKADAEDRLNKLSSAVSSSVTNLKIIDKPPKSS